MELWTAFLLGFVGSAHCAGMCGPLALALPPTGRSRVTFVSGRAAYNAGRILTYALLGALFGLLGQSLVLAGLQRWVSLAAGALILTALLLGVLVPAGSAAGSAIAVAFGIAFFAAALLFVTALAIVLYSAASSSA